MKVGFLLAICVANVNSWCQISNSLGAYLNAWLFSVLVIIYNLFSLFISTFFKSVITNSGPNRKKLPLITYDTFVCVLSKLLCEDIRKDKFKFYRPPSSHAFTGKVRQLCTPLQRQLHDRGNRLYPCTTKVNQAYLWSSLCRIN